MLVMNNIINLYYILRNAKLKFQILYTKQYTLIKKIIEKLCSFEHFYYENLKLLKLLQNI